MDKKEFIRRIAEKRDISKEDFSLIPDEVIMTRKYTLICKYHGPKTSYGHSLLNHECRFCVQRRNGIKIKDFFHNTRADTFGSPPKKYKPTEMSAFIY